MTDAKPAYADSVFINCPFDEQFWPLFEAIVFCVIDCGFVPRCALEEDDSGTTRLEKIRGLIQGSQYGIHDLSRVEITGPVNLPRFNMPFEFGLDLGCKLFGEASHTRKRSLVLDSDKYRYRASISDISGQDIRSHDNDPGVAISVIRGWLRTASGRKNVPHAKSIKKRFAAFTALLPELAESAGADREDLEFVEYVTLAEVFIKAQRAPG
jgi:hypothetical protein